MKDRHAKIRYVDVAGCIEDRTHGKRDAPIRDDRQQRCRNEQRVGKDHEGIEILLDGGTMIAHGALLEQHLRDRADEHAEEVKPGEGEHGGVHYASPPLC